MTPESVSTPTVAGPGRSTSLALPFALRGEEGERLNFGDTTIIIRASAESTAGAFTLFEEVPPLGDTSRHVHDNEDEMFYVLEGEHDFECGDQSFRLGAGGLVFLPRGIPHAHRRVVPRVGRLLVLTVPGGLDGFFRALAAADRAGGLTATAVARASESHGITWVS
jgi:mannose-6-phosphate isomerase-like protein (cupin superfamily)